jgi:hypothetical protein
LNGNGSIARVENSSAEENARSRILSTIEQWSVASLQHTPL